MKKNFINYSLELTTFDKIHSTNLLHVRLMNILIISVTRYIRMYLRNTIQA